MRAGKEPVESDNLWAWVGWGAAVGLIVVGAVLGFGLLGREQPNGHPPGLWAGICNGLGFTSDTEAENEPQPPLITPTRIAWTRDTLSQIASGDITNGEFVAMNCTPCHGPQGASLIGIFPSLAGMDAAVIYKQLDDFRAGKRRWGAMNGIAQALSTQASADVAAYFASRTNGLAPLAGGHPQAGRPNGEPSTAERLVLVGDPARGIPACSACHGPDGRKPGAPPLQGQQPVYIEGQLAAFAQGMRQNDINLQMRTIAAQLKPEEMHDLASFYGGALNMQLARR
jgi:cytochrome c553